MFFTSKRLSVVNKKLCVKVILVVYVIKSFKYIAHERTKKSIITNNLINLSLILQIFITLIFHFNLKLF